MWFWLQRHAATTFYPLDGEEQEARASHCRYLPPLSDWGCGAVDPEGLYQFSNDEEFIQEDEELKVDSLKKRHQDDDGQGDFLVGGDVAGVEVYKPKESDVEESQSAEDDHKDGDQGEDVKLDMDVLQKRDKSPDKDFLVGGDVAGVDVSKSDKKKPKPKEPEHDVTKEGDHLKKRDTGPVEDFIMAGDVDGMGVSTGSDKNSEDKVTEEIDHFLMGGDIAGVEMAKKHWSRLRPARLATYTSETRLEQKVLLKEPMGQSSGEEAGETTPQGICRYPDTLVLRALHSGQGVFELGWQDDIDDGKPLQTLNDAACAEIHHEQGSMNCSGTTYRHSCVGPQRTIVGVRPGRYTAESPSHESVPLDMCLEFFMGPPRADLDMVCVGSEGILRTGHSPLRVYWCKRTGDRTGSGCVAGN
ncbi:hypothetical protein CDD82_7284 [Ophiocordyceps australis]|uniref:Uncharacterized protein n=1 Tax=Ophiocordyceps australis TaxID=1399860 RepID=A0A2C5XF69_9HYPO|nr:hypothetical protein CDD82_7284 [Ophiocordyceps australis]